MKIYPCLFSATCVVAFLVSPFAVAQSSCTPEHAAMGHCTMPAAPKLVAPAVSKIPVQAKPKPAQLPKVSPSNVCAPEHAALGHCTLDKAIPISDGSATTNIPMPYHDAMDMHDDPVVSKVMIDRLEFRDTEHGKPLILEADAWFGKSINKLWLKADIEVMDGKWEEAQLHVLYNRAFSPFWDIQAGIRHDFKPVQRSWAALGVHGTAPYFIETNATAFVGEAGRSAIQLSAEKEFMLTQKTILMPEFALNIYGKDDHDLGVGSGLSELNLGLRLSHEIKREFAPYIGVNWSKKLGNTAEMAKGHGDKTQNTELLLGIQAWF